MNSISSWLVHRDRWVDEWAVELPCTYLLTHLPANFSFRGVCIKQASKQTSEQVSMFFFCQRVMNQRAMISKIWLCLFVCMHLEFEERVKQKRGKAKHLGVMNHRVVMGTRRGQLFLKSINDDLTMYTLHTI